MARAWTNPVDDRIRYYCTSHPTQVPIVTLHEQRWAYCPGGYVAAGNGHFWTAIEPMNVHQVNPRQIGFARSQGLGRTI